ncbi:MAG: lytic murein transglycosylase [Prevotella veroralis]|jgi:putative membrane-bound lytic murein transglycosylase
MKEIEKKGKPYVQPLVVLVRTNTENQLLAGSVQGDHESAGNDEAYAKQYSWDIQEVDNNDWRNNLEDKKKKSYYE